MRSLFITLLPLLFLASCTTKQIQCFEQGGDKCENSTAPVPVKPGSSSTDSGTPDPVVSPTPVPVTPAPAFKLGKISWDGKIPSCLDCSQYTYDLIAGPLWASFSKVKDANKFCPKYDSLSKEQKGQALTEIIASMTAFESSYNIASSSVDVGTEGDLNTYSVGLLQLSVVDQTSYKLPLGYTYADLKTAKKNLNLGLQIMAKQIDKYGEIVISSGVYWAVIREGESYISRADYCKKNPNTCAASKWKSGGYCAMQGTTCRYTNLPDVIAKVKANQPMCL